MQNRNRRETACFSDFLYCLFAFDTTAAVSDYHIRCYFAAVISIIILWTIIELRKGKAPRRTAQSAQIPLS